MMSPRTLVRNKTSVVGEFLLFLVMLGDLWEMGRGKGRGSGRKDGNLWGMGISRRWEGRMIIG